MGLPNNGGTTPFPDSVGPGDFSPAATGGYGKIDKADDSKGAPRERQAPAVFPRRPSLQLLPRLSGSSGSGGPGKDGS